MHIYECSFINMGTFQVSGKLYFFRNLDKNVYMDKSTYISTYIAATLAAIWFLGLNKIYIVINLSNGVTIFLYMVVLITR